MDFTPVLIALFPGIEIRGAVVYSWFNGLGLLDGYLAPLIASMLIAPLVYYAIDFIVLLAAKLKIVDRILERSRKKVKDYVDKYGFLGLLLFVSIPLPGTGVYTGSLGAAILGMDKRRAIPALMLGNLFAFFLVTLGLMIIR